MFPEIFQDFLESWGTEFSRAEETHLDKIQIAPDDLDWLIANGHRVLVFANTGVVGG